MDVYLPADLRDLRQEFPDWCDAPANVGADLHATEQPDARCTDTEWQVI